MPSSSASVSSIPITLDTVTESMDEEGLAWRLAGLPGAVPQTSYLNSANVHQFRVIVEVMHEQQSQRLTGVAAAELPDLIRAHLERRLATQHAARLLADDGFNLSGRLTALVRWGVLEQWQDDALTDADFLRNRERFQLTERGSALHQLIASLERDDDEDAGRALLSPVIIDQRLTETAGALRQGDVEAASIAVNSLQETVAGMARTARLWQSRLAAGLGGAPTEEKVARVRSTVLDYVEVWGSGVDVFSTQIVRGVQSLADLTDGQWRGIALHRHGSAADPDTLHATITGIRTTLSTLTSWFAPDGQAERLRRQVRDAVSPLLRGHRTLLAIGGAVSRRAELLELAGRVDSAPDDAAAWQLWCQATGLYPARHLRLVAPEATPAVSIWTAAPAKVEQRLRTQGPRALTGRAPLVADTSRHRAAARARASAERARLAEAELALAARSGTPFSAWAPLDADQADLLLDLLSTAQATRPSSKKAARQAVSRDGRWTARFLPVIPRASAVLRLPTGRLVVDDAVMELTG